MSKKELDFADVRQLCAGIAAKEEILVVVIKTRRYSVISLPPQRRKSSGSASNISQADVKTLEDILLNDLNIKGRDGLMKRMSNILRPLKTTDLDTAKSFIELPRYSHVRQNVIQQLDEYVAKDLKMTIASRKLEG